MPALVALRNAPFDPDPRARLNGNAVRGFFASPVTEVANVSTSRRDKRRFVHVRMEVPDVRRLGEAPAFAWSRYAMTDTDNVTVYEQAVGPAAGRQVGDVGWNGQELVAFRLHLPSRVPFHNAPSRAIERGNIIQWVQPLTARLKGEPLTLEVHMEPRSILFQTLTLYALTMVAALATMAAAVWWVMRRKGAQNIAAS